MNLIKRSLFFLFSSLFFSAYSQEMKPKKTVHPFFIEPKFHYGFIIPHSSSMRSAVPHHFMMYDLTVNFPTYGCNDAEKAYNYPIYGLTYLFSTLGNPKNFGSLNAIEAHVTFPLVRREKFLFTYRIGPGIGYIAKPFDRLENYKNTAIGSTFNMSVMMMFEIRQQLSKRLTFASGIAFTHFSNGAYTIPNLGINIPTVHASLIYLVGQEREKACRDSLKKPKKFNYFVMTNIGAKEIYPIGVGRFPVYNVSFNVSRITGHKSAWGLMLEYTYNSALVDEYRQMNQPLKNNLEISRLGLFASYEQRVHRTSIVMGMGGYLISKWKEDGLFYHRLGLRYYAKNGWILNWSLKTHFAVADCFEFGVGYMLHRKKQK